MSSTFTFASDCEVLEHERRELTLHEGDRALRVGCVGSFGTAVDRGGKLIVLPIVVQHTGMIEQDLSWLHPVDRVCNSVVGKLGGLEGRHRNFLLLQKCNIYRAAKVSKSPITFS
jgi:hypothetical protein